MSRLADLFTPKNDQEKEQAAIERLSLHLQVELHKLMVESGVDRKELAERLGCSPARVSQYLSDQGPNLTLKTIARIFHALGHEVGLSIKHNDKVSTVPRRVDESKVRKIAASVERHKSWRGEAANDNPPPGISLAA